MVEEEQGLERFRTLLHGALAGDDRITPLRGFRFHLSGLAEHQKFFFAARCPCGTAALLSVEVPLAKTAAELEAALPLLVQRLRDQAVAFYDMPCEAHGRLALGRRTARPGEAATLEREEG